MPTHALPTGRRLGYAEYGRPDGHPVFGAFGAAARRFRPPDDATAAAGVRLILLERPGFGLSDPQPGRTLLDWPGDVVALADALGLDRFGVVASSQAGPYGAACAYAIPERLTAVARVSALAPFDARVTVWQGTEDPNVPPAMGRYLARAIPGAALQEVPGAGHLLAWERWGEILAGVTGAGGITTATSP